jgi:Ferredoxin-like domain in Api92-like protein
VPNWSYNVLTVTGPSERLREFKHAVRSAQPDPETGKRAVLDLGRHLPMPPELLADKGDLAAGRLPDWSACRLEHWGTKWNAMWPTLSWTLRSGELRYRFQTAWTPPVEWLQFVAAVHPALAFELTYQEELDHFSGVMRFEAGGIVEDRCRSDLPTAGVDPGQGSSMRAS